MSSQLDFCFVFGWLGERIIVVRRCGPALFLPMINASSVVGGFRARSFPCCWCTYEEEVQSSLALLTRLASLPFPPPPPVSIALFSSPVPPAGGGRGERTAGRKGPTAARSSLHYLNKTPRPHATQPPHRHHHSLSALLCCVLPPSSIRVPNH